MKRGYAECAFRLCDGGGYFKILDASGAEIVSTPGSAGAVAGATVYLATEVVEVTGTVAQWIWWNLRRM